MTDPVFDWSDTLNQRVCIGVRTWNGKDALLPDRAQRRDVRMYLPKQKIVHDLPSAKELAPRPSRVTVPCACGRPKARKCGTCRVCYQAKRRLGRKAA